MNTLTPGPPQVSSDWLLFCGKIHCHNRDLRVVARHESICGEPYYCEVSARGRAFPTIHSRRFEKENWLKNIGTLSAK
jgi:hypothetical protein